MRDAPLPHKMSRTVARLLGRMAGTWGSAQRDMTPTLRPDSVALQRSVNSMFETRLAAGRRGRPVPG